MSLLGAIDSLWDEIDELHRRGRHEKRGRHERLDVSVRVRYLDPTSSLAAVTVIPPQPIPKFPKTLLDRLAQLQGRPGRIG